MFDFGLSELLLIGAVALVVLGPERLPHAARMAGRLVGKLQQLVSSVKQELNAQADLDELRKAKQEFEAAATQLKDELASTGQSAQSSLHEISDGLKPWERLPEQRTPADFGLDAEGKPLPVSNDADAGSDTAEAAAHAETAAEPAAADSQDQAWRDYLTGAKPSEIPQVSYSEYEAPPPDSHYPAYGGTGFHTVSLRKQAMQRKRDMRPKFRAQPKLRVRKK
ncbi:Sec-independent protein translocase protein TatB [Bergeriella denitrificans]|uniref:Sec-independent protein translocase protein TatB n=1 Tax=Bergeriella denitrificans TaxID=494 RepID=A0A378UDN7_BERDE|nr:Sec-independent protein translocase protein TatB [Bergeriella denitrificans]STZ75417.1 sec-independent protein translocase component [Bergeriella denitrificans]